MAIYTYIYIYIHTYRDIMAIFCGPSHLGFVPILIAELMVQYLRHIVHLAADRRDFFGGRCGQKKDLVSMAERAWYRSRKFFLLR